MADPAPITELPLLEATLWESAVVAEREGDHDEAIALSALLDELGYNVLWERAMVLVHRGTEQTMRCVVHRADGC